MPYLQGLHEGLGARLGNGTQVVNEVCFGHANSSINDGQGPVSLVGDDVNFQILATVQLGGISQTFIADFVQSLLEEKKKKNLVVTVVLSLSFFIYANT